jgi:hypothetical protein
VYLLLTPVIAAAKALDSTQTFSPCSTLTTNLLTPLYGLLTIISTEIVLSSAE